MSLKDLLGKVWQKTKSGIKSEVSTMATKRTIPNSKDTPKAAAPKKAAPAKTTVPKAVKTRPEVSKVTTSKTPVKKASAVKVSAAPKAAAKASGKKTATTAPKAAPKPAPAKAGGKKTVALALKAPTKITPPPAKPVNKGKLVGKGAKAPVVSLRTPVKKKGKGELAGGINPYKSKKGENYMNEPQKAHFRSLLLAWKTELMEEVDRTVSHMKDEATNFPDPSDRATQEEEFSLELRARDRERKLIKKIDSTLELIDQDEYGYCEACGINIGIARLEARPTATQCIDCKTLAEIKEKQIGT